MSWSDLFFPGNPEKKAKIIRIAKKLLELMKNNFQATNYLTEAVNMHLGSSFRPITLDEKATVKENCDVVTERVHEIQAKVQKINDKLKKNLEPVLYERLQKQSLGAQDFTKVKFALASVCLVSASVLVTYLMKNITILRNISTCAKIAVGLFTSVVFGMVLDMIISGIVGYIEHSHLEKTLAEYEAALAEFRPASNEYQEAITELNVVLEYLK